MVNLVVYTAKVPRPDAINTALAKWCANTSGDSVRHVGTATVLRDLEYLNLIIGDDAPVSLWGFSGTAIGTYFVNMSS